jgi:hypothetical protein
MFEQVFLAAICPNQTKFNSEEMLKNIFFSSSLSVGHVKDYSRVGPGSGAG